MVTKAQQTADQYNQTKLELGSKISAVQNEKRKTAASVKELMSFKGEKEAKLLGKEARKVLTEKFKEENKELISTYQNLSKEHLKNEKIFQEIYAKVNYQAKCTIN